MEFVDSVDKVYKYLGQLVAVQYSFEPGVFLGPYYGLVVKSDDDPLCRNVFIHFLDDASPLFVDDLTISANAEAKHSMFIERVMDRGIKEDLFSEQFGDLNRNSSQSLIASTSMLLSHSLCSGKVVGDKALKAIVDYRVGY